MKRSHLIILFGLICQLSLQSCDKARVFDENKDIANDAWFYKNRLLFDVNIEDTARFYNFYVNLRVNNEYNYCDLFLILHQTNPGKAVQSERKEFILADPSGRWLGKGLGDLHDYQMMVYQNMKFSEKGIYRFELEQNMRNDTLMNVKSAGIRIEDASLAKE